MTLKQYRLLFVGIAVLLVSIIGYFIFYYIRQLDHIAVRLFTVPSSATIAIDSKAYSNGTIWLIPGTYTLTISKDGFETYSEKITVARGDKNITASLTPQSEDAKTWANNNADQYEELEILANEQSDVAIERRINGHPELGSLPYSLPAFTIEARITDENAMPVLLISAYEGSRNAAIERLFEIGIDPGKYAIEFDDFTNPFKEQNDE